jgi:hypothetical protein
MNTPQMLIVAMVTFVVYLAATHYRSRSSAVSFFVVATLGWVIASSLFGGQLHQLVETAGRRWFLVGSFTILVAMLASLTAGLLRIEAKPSTAPAASFADLTYESELGDEQE